MTSTVPEDLHSFICIVHNLQPLNAVNIKDAVTLFCDELFAKQSAGQSIYIMMDLFVEFDYKALMKESHDLIIFQTSLSTFCFTTLPIRWNVAVSVTF